MSMPIDRGMEVVTAFRTEVFIAPQHKKSVDGVVHIELFERGSAKSLPISSAIGECPLAIACRHLGGEMLVLALGKVIIAHCSQNFPIGRECPVGLHESIGRVLYP